MHVSRCIVLAAGLLAAVPAQAFRTIDAIHTPQAAEALETDGFTRVEDPIPVPDALAREQIEDLMRAWNSVALEGRLTDDFRDRTRLLDALRADAPRDAALRVLSVSGVRTHDQVARSEGRGLFSVVSLVSARIRVQAEFHDPAFGFRRLENTGEYVFQIEMKVRRQ